VQVVDDTVAVLRGLHVFRSLGNYFEGRWQLGMRLLGEDGAVAPLMQKDNSPLDLWAKLTDSYEGIQVLQKQLSDDWAPTEGVDIVDHPGGFQLMAVQLPIEGVSVRLVLGPFVFSEQRASRIRTIRKALIAADVPATVTQEYAERVPPLDRRDIHHIAELMDILSKEAGHHASECQHQERRREKRRNTNRSRHAHIIGESASMVELFHTLDRVSESESTVYIHGENGTGKELVAREVHVNSPRSDAPFVVQNCSALNDNLLESELFGHIHGAFTGAIADKPGLFNTADGGTLFFDEIGEMSPALQVKLLRVLQEGTFTAVGDVGVQKVDVRILCATNRDLLQLVKDGLFREDLYYRINVINLRIPPLRERRDDIPLLIDHFLSHAAQDVVAPSSRGRKPKAGPGGRKRLSRDALTCLMDYDWPGNVRELENEIERLLVLNGPMITTIDQDLLSPRIRYRPLPDPVLTAVHTDLSLPEALEAMERAMIFEHLKRCRWNKTKTAQALGVSRRNLIRKVSKYGLDRRQS
jgi:two-component system response regulator HupR/HoxA